MSGQVLRGGAFMWQREIKVIIYRVVAAGTCNWAIPENIYWVFITF